MTSIMVVSATRRTEWDFREGSALGTSLRRLSFDARIRSRIAYQNGRGLPEVYNQAIRESQDSDVLVFVHDDVWIDDSFLADRLQDALLRYDVVGVAGNRRRQPRQPAWAFADMTLAWDDKAHLSGGVAHGAYPFGGVSYFGGMPADCELLDGVFLAARRAALSQARVEFDPRFGFHFYDMDFCRSARQAGLRLGTWPIALTHQSGGAFGSDAWQAAYGDYLAKWGD
ncbi:MULTISPECIES: glycosyltransferase [unclassified Pseudoxanthomonas]|uniref:glycosyltransferase n=1 Tax=unclassified Pseudoxanthomonas TaxID=2645906 RepID=UPI00307E67D7